MLNCWSVLWLHVFTLGSKDHSLGKRQILPLHWNPCSQERRNLSPSPATFLLIYLSINGTSAGSEMVCIPTYQQFLFLYLLEPVRCSLMLAKVNWQSGFLDFLPSSAPCHLAFTSVSLSITQGSSYWTVSWRNVEPNSFPCIRHY